MGVCPPSMDGDRGVMTIKRGEVGIMNEGIHSRTFFSRDQTSPARTQAGRSFGNANLSPIT